MDWTLVLGACALFSLISLIWQWVAAVRFPLHQRVTTSHFDPSVTVLKPLKGADAHTAACLESWATQDYPGAVQLLLGVASLADPACEIVKELIRTRPGREIQLVECSEALGSNPKVSKLIQLERLARHEFVVVSDADVRVPPDLLTNLVAPLQQKQVGLVNCFYRLMNPANLAMRCEAVATNADFWSQVLQGRTLGPIDFALGAVMATRRSTLAKIGGFEGVKDFLADDFQLGHRIAHNGQRIELCPVVVECWDPPMNWREVWSHQVRWQRTIRVSKPWPYAFSILANPMLWPLLFVLVSHNHLSLGILIVSLAVRLAVTADLLRRMQPHSRAWIWCWLAPLKDITGTLLWVIALAGNHISWRGTNYRLLRDGQLAPTVERSAVGPR